MRCVVETMVMCLLGISVAPGQTPQAGQAEKPLMAEDAFKNVQVLRGIPVKEFMDTMGFFSASTGLNCTDCHTKESGGNWAKYADDTPLKQTARRMVVMVKAINQADFGGERRVTCYTCHAGSTDPQVLPSLTVQYGPPPPEDPDEVTIIPSIPKTPTADQILDRYIQALGGTEQLANMTSFIARGTSSGYNTDFQEVPVEVYGKAPDQLTTVAHFTSGDSTSTYDGHNAWLAMPPQLQPIPVLRLFGGDLEDAKVQAQLSFPGQIKRDLTNWQVGFPITSLDGHAAQVVEGTTSGGTEVKLYFDKQSGLLVRRVSYSGTPVGLVPTDTVYSDYRTVGGVKIPFRWVVTWVDGQDTYQLSEVHLNAPVAAARFAKPASSAKSAKPAGAP